MLRLSRSLAVEELEDRIVPTLLGQQLFPADNPWNQNISAAPVDPNSPTMMAAIGVSTRVTPDWGANPNNLFQQVKMYGIPVNIVHGNSANVIRTNVIIDNYPGESDLIQVPLPTNYQPVIEGDYPNGPNNNGPGSNGSGNTQQRGDSHLIVWDEDTNVAYELYGAARPTDPTLFPNTNGVELPHTDNQWHAAQETVFNMKTDNFRTIGATSADAAGLSILAGLARPDEGLPVSQGGTGVIDHALRVTLNGNQIAPREFTYPASHMVTGQNGPIPLGARLRLMNTPAIDQLISQMGPQSQILAQAMQQYGLIVADVGSPMYITGTDEFVDNVDPGVSNLTWNEQDIFAALPGHPAGVESLNAGDFQVVDLAPIVTGLSTANASSGSTITITGQNFSGAAGRLSVLFSSPTTTTAATSFTIVDNSHLTAVVPNGSGTVNVQVQSGTNEIDQLDLPDHPNVTETMASGYRASTLFGYGISALTPADQFTYQTVNGANSTDSFANAIVAAGNTDTLTIVVKDSVGNAVTGLASSAFGLNLGSGTSAGTFGPVTATATAGTYTATFTGTIVGTARVLTVTVNGVSLSNSPSITVAPGIPTAVISPVSPNPRNSAVSSLTITFNEAVTGFVLSDLQWLRNGIAVSLSGATLTTNDQITWTLGNLASLTNPTHRWDKYTLTLIAAGSGITGPLGNPMTSNASTAFTVLDPSLSLQGSTLTVLGTPGNDVFTFNAGIPERITLNGVSYNVDPTVTTINFVGNGGSDSADLTGSGGDFAVLLPTSVSLSGAGYLVDAVNCANATVYSSGNSTANFATTTNVDSFVGTPTYSATRGANYANYAVGFAHTHAWAEAVHNTANLVTSAGQDVFGGIPAYSFVAGTTYDSYAIGFAQVDGYPGSTTTRAYLGMSAGNDTFDGLPTYSAVQGTNYAVYAIGFSFVAGYAGGVNSTATLATGNGQDTYIGTPNYSEVTGVSYAAFALGFAHLNAYAGSSNSVAYLTTSAAASDTFASSSINSQASGAAYSNTAWGFANVTVSAGGGGQLANFYDSPGNNTFTGSGSSALLAGTSYRVQGIGFGTVGIHSPFGGNDRRFVNALDYVFTQDSGWQ